MEPEEKTRRMSEWADGVQDGSIEFLEVALDMKEASRAGYEWPWLIGLYLEMFANLIRNGSCAPDFDAKLKTRIKVARTTASRGYLGPFQEMSKMLSGEQISALDNMNEVFIELWNKMPGSREIDKILSEAATPQQQELPIVTVVTPPNGEFPTAV